MYCFLKPLLLPPDQTKYVHCCFKKTSGSTQEVLNQYSIMLESEVTLNRIEIFYNVLSSILRCDQPGLMEWTYLGALFSETALCALLDVSRSFKEKCPLSGAKTRVSKRKHWHVVLCWYRHVLLYFYYIASGMYYFGSEFKYPGTVAKKRMLYCVGNMPYTKPNPKPTR